MRTINDVMNLSIEDLELSVRSINCMKNMGIRTLAELTGKKQEDFIKIRNMGKKSQAEITSKLEAIGLTYEMTNRDWLNWGVNHIDWIKLH